MAMNDDGIACLTAAAATIFASSSEPTVAPPELDEEPPLSAPFPWFGGKSLAAPIIWRAFGDVPNYVEPFAGSLATLLARPGGAGKVETVNDKDGFISNFWRATKLAPDEVAKWCDWPVNEADLHARHRWLVAQEPLLDKLIEDPDFFDARIAGWWVWGICAWIGGGWCHPDRRLERRRPELANANGRGVQTLQPTWSQRPAISNAGMGVHSLARQIPKVGAPGNGVHAPGHATGRKKPLTHRNKGVHARGSLVETFEQLAARLRAVRICCGDWTRVMGRSTLGIDTAHGMTPCGIMLDPPYTHAIRDKRLYRADEDVAGDVREWAIENGDNPMLRIALCGFEGEHDMPSSWECVAWRSKTSSKNRGRERLWFSPHCLTATTQGSLFDV